ncbi:CoA transferase [Mycetocola zhadangensis]|uniref:CaiB/BaiF CoA-transferase family protein n=1 Tax=Mycetocola zhadangensis TaxID=1164595 RepID=UPI003A4DC455
MMLPHDHLPMSGVRVLDLSDSLGTYCGRLLADFGADVVKIEPAGGIRSRTLPPFRNGVTDPDGALGFLYYEANKRGTVLDASSEDSIADLRALARDADVIIVTPTARNPVAGLSPSARNLSWAPESAVVVSITPYGLTGPYRDWRATHLTSSAMSGLLIQQGAADGPPVQVPGNQLYAHVGTQAAIAVLAALRARNAAGGQFADLSAHEILTASNFSFHQYSSAGIVGKRVTVEPNENGGIWGCRDGLIEFQVSTDKHWAGLVSLLGSPPQLGDPKLGHPSVRAQARDAIVATLRPMIEQMDREAFVAEGQALGVPCALVNTVGEYVNDPQPRSRGFFVDATLADGSTMEMPGAPYLATEPLLSLYARPAPRLGQETIADILKSWGERRTTEVQTKPLADVRVLCFGTAIAGALTGSALAELGADVVKIESPTRPDNLRRLSYPEEAPGQEPSGAATSSMFANFNRSMRSISMDMKDPAAVELFLRIAGTVDVVIDNYGPGVMRRWGIPPARLAEANPHLVQLSLTGFGHTDGPRSHYLAYGATVCSFVGLTRAWGYSSGTHFDYLSEAHGVLAVLAALASRDVTRKGVFVDLAEVEAGGVMMPTLLLDRIVNGIEAEPAGNRVDGSVWSGVVRCAGIDAWLAVEAETRKDWSALVSAIGQRELPESSVRTGEFEQALRAWAVNQTPLQAARRLQAAGIAAAPAQNAEDLFRDPQHRERGFVIEIEHPDLGKIEFPGPVHRLNRTPATVTSAAPRLGEHGDDILAEWLGLAERERDEYATANAFWRPAAK